MNKEMFFFYFKPKETRLLSETAGLFQPKYVAQCIIQDAVVRMLMQYCLVLGWHSMYRKSASDMLAEVYIHSLKSEKHHHKGSI